MDINSKSSMLRFMMGSVERQKWMQTFGFARIWTYATEINPGSEKQNPPFVGRVLFGARNQFLRVSQT
jgi:hypothetical protein